MPTHMKKIPPEVQKTYEKLKEKFDFYIELKHTKGSYAIRRATSIWDKEKKKTKKITIHIGTIKKDGTFREKIPQSAIRPTGREVFEYGNGALAYALLEDAEGYLEVLTPFSKEIINYAIIKVIDSQPLRLLQSRWEKLYISTQVNITLNPKHMSEVLRSTGQEVSLWYTLFSKFTVNGDIILYDWTTIFTQSERIKLAEKGWNTKHKDSKQIAVIMAFSASSHLPLGIEVFPGTLKDVTTIKDFRERFHNTDVCYIIDRGFSSYKLLKELRGAHSSYIVPLQKDSKYMDKRWLRWKGAFLYRKRPLRWGRKKCDLGYVYFYEDPKVKGEQESRLLKQLEQGTITMEAYEKKQKVAGLIGFLSNLDKPGPEIYDLYKGREDVELAFDALNNHIDSDKSYLQTEEGVRGYYFVSFLALRIYFGILKRLREKDLTHKISVNEVLLELSKVMKIKEKGGREYFSQFTKRSTEMMSLFPEVFNAI